MKTAGNAVPGRGEGSTSGRRSLVAVAWAAFQPRTAAIATAFGGQALFISTPTRGGAGRLAARYVVSAIRTWRALERRQPEIVVVITPPVFAPLVSWAWCRWRARRFVIDCHTDTFHSPRWRWALPVHRWLLCRATTALVHTQEASELVKEWGAAALLLPDDLPSPSDAERRMSAPTRPTVLVAGSLDGNEPVEESLSMAAHLPDVEFRVTGDPRQLPGALADGAPANVVFTGFLPYRQFLGEMQAADVVTVFSTDLHIMNRAAFEAIGLGRPLVLSDLEGLRERFGAGAAFAANRPEAMATVVAEALDSKASMETRSRDLALVLNRQRERALAQLSDVLEDSGQASSPGRVLLLTQHAFPFFVTPRRSVQELLSQGFEVDVVCSASPDPSTEKTLESPQLRVYRIPVRHRRRPLIRYPVNYAAFFVGALATVSWLGLRRRYAAVQVDNLPDFLVFAAPVPRVRGARLVFSMYELTPEMIGARFRGHLGRVLAGFGRLVERAAIGWADHVIVVSRPCFDALVARGVAPERMSVVLNTAAEQAGAGGREQPESNMALITHGTLVRRYGVDVIIRAVALLRQEFPDLTLRVVGDGEQVGALVSLAQALGVADRVVFTGPLPWEETRKEVLRARLGIVAVLADGYGELMLPIKLLEYTQFGVPAVCSRLPAIEAYFSADSVSYFRPGDEHDLASRVRDLLGDPGRARRQAEQAEAAARRIGWEHVREDYLRALGLAARSEPALANRRASGSVT